MAIPVEHHEASGHDLTTDKSRQGESSGRMRYVLGISLLAVVLIFAAMLVFGS